MPLPRRALLQVLGATGVVVLSGCGMRNEEAATPSPTPSAADLLELASRQLARTRTVHFALDVEGDTFVDNARSIRLLGAEGDLVRPDRVRTAFQAEILGRAVSLQLITVGALGPKMCAAAGETADGVLLNWLTADYVAPSAAIVDEAARQAKRPRPLIMGYVRTAYGPGAREVFASEAARYASFPAYAANFARMGTPAEATAVAGDSREEIQAGLAPFTTELDETVVRAITGEESAEAYLALLAAAAPRT